MGWFEMLRELCNFVVLDTTIQDVLETAVEENMLTLEEARQIAHEISYEVEIN